MWDTQAWQQVLQLDTPLSVIAFAPDSRTLAVAQNKIITLHDLFSSTKPFSFDTPQQPQSMTFSPNGEILATSIRGEIAFWNVADGSKTRSLAVPDGTQPDNLTFSPDGRHLVAKNTITRTSVYVWPLANQAFPLKLTTSDDPHSRWVFAPDSSTLAIGLDEERIGRSKAKGRVELWTLDPAPTLYKTLTTRGLYRDPNPLAFSSDGSLLAVAGRYEIYVFEVRE